MTDIVGNEPELHIHRYGYGYLTQWRAKAVRAHWRLYFNPEAGAQVSCGSTTVELDGSQVLLMPPHTAFDQVLNAPCYSLHIHFSLGPAYDRVQGQLFDIPVARCPKRLPLQLIKQLSSEAESPHPGVRWALRALIYSAVAELPSDIWQRERRESRVEAVLAMVERNPLALWDNDALANQVHLTPNAFVRLFRQVMGTPPQTYLRHRRLQEAALRLVTTDESVEQIAQACGFCNRHYFSRSFRQAYLCGPATYRKQAREG